MLYDKHRPFLGWCFCFPLPKDLVDGKRSIYVRGYTGRTYGGMVPATEASEYAPVRVCKVNFNNFVYLEDNIQRLRYGREKVW